MDKLVRHDMYNLHDSCLKLPRQSQPVARERSIQLHARSWNNFLIGRMVCPLQCLRAAREQLRSRRSPCFSSRKQLHIKRRLTFQARAVQIRLSLGRTVQWRSSPIHDCQMRVWATCSQISRKVTEACTMVTVASNRCQLSRKLCGLARYHCLQLAPCGAAMPGALACRDREQQLGRSSKAQARVLGSHGERSRCPCIFKLASSCSFSSWGGLLPCKHHRGMCVCVYMEESRSWILYGQDDSAAPLLSLLTRWLGGFARVGRHVV